MFRDVFEKVVFHVGYYLLQSLHEFVEILFIEEDLVFVKGETAVGFLPALAFGDVR